MGLVIYALKFRITFYVMSILILLAGIGGYVVMPKDVLPDVNIPVVTVVWTYTGLDTPEMEQRVTTYTEFALSNNVNGIRNMESTTLQGVTITRIYFQPDVSIDLAMSQVTAATNSIRAALPPGIQPPVVMRFSASSVPVIQLALSSNQENERQLYDYAPVPHPPDADAGAGFDPAVALWRRAAPDHGRSGPACAAGATA